MPQKRARAADSDPLWYRRVAVAFLKGYVTTAAPASSFLPQVEAELAARLDVSPIEKGIHELEYELNRRHDWVHIPRRGIRTLFDTAAEGSPP